MIDFNTNETVRAAPIIRVAFGENRLSVMLGGRDRLENSPKAQTLYKIQIADGVSEKEYLVEFLSYNYIIMSNNYTNEDGEQVSELAVGDNTLLFKTFQ